MAHIHSDSGQHDLTTSAYIIRRDIDGVPRVLLHMHRKLHRLLQPGGHVELHENPWAALSHELEEETGYRLSELEVMQPKIRIQSGVHVLNHPQPLSINTHQFADQEHFHTDIAFLLLTHDIPSHPPHDGESTDIRWVSQVDIESDMKAFLYPDTYQVVRQIFETFLNEWQPVPTTEFPLEIPGH